MPDVRYPGAVWTPGINAGYVAGRTTMESVVCHYTVGRDSSSIGRQGYFQFLVARDGRIQQFAEVDAVCWHAGQPWNGRGPGVEVEYLDEPTIFTPEAEAACGALCDWLTSAWGVPASFYDGPRVNTHHGFITHRSLIQTGDAHSDYWPYLPTGAPPTPEEYDGMWLIHDTQTNLDWLATSLGPLIQVPGDQVFDLVAAGVKRYDLPTRTVQWINDNLRTASSGGGGQFPTSGTWTADA